MTVLSVRFQAPLNKPLRQPLTEPFWNPILQFSGMIYHGFITVESAKQTKEL